jgi:hypothetical protein
MATYSYNCVQFSKTMIGTAGRTVFENRNIVPVNYVIKNVIICTLRLILFTKNYIVVEPKCSTSEHKIHGVPRIR